MKYSWLIPILKYNITENSGQLSIPYIQISVVILNVSVADFFFLSCTDDDAFEWPLKTDIFLGNSIHFLTNGSSSESSGSKLGLISVSEELETGVCTVSFAAKLSPRAVPEELEQPFLGS